MKLILTSLLAISLVGCATFDPSRVVKSPLTSPAISLSTSAALKYGISNSEDRTRVANYICVAAKAIDSLVTVPGIYELNDQVLSYIPKDVQTEYPEIISTILPLVSSYYSNVLASANGDQKQMLEGLHVVSAGLYNGAKPYISK